FELPERYRQRISERNIHITLFPHFFTSLPHYFALESRYNSYAIPAFQDCLPGVARCRRNSQPSSSPSPIGGKASPLFLCGSSHWKTSRTTTFGTPCAPNRSRSRA